MYISPPFISSTPAIIFKRVVFPQPDGPRITKKSRSSTQKEISLKTGTSLSYDLAKLMTLSFSIIIIPY